MEDFTFSPGQHLQNRAETGTEDFVLTFGKLTTQSLNSEYVWGEGVCVFFSASGILGQKHRLW